MPHSAGGGSHGGGGHGGGGYHGGGSGSGNRISTHYFAGARRFRRHYTDGRPDEYVYATGKPAKAGLSSVIILCVAAGFFMFSSMFGIVGNVPKKLKTKYWDAPRVYDDVDLIANDEELESILMEYCDTTGICPVIYTTFNEEWEYNEGDTFSYADLESYAFDKYVTNFSDEQHLVIVYSVPMDDAIALYNGEKFVPDYQWEAIQGDETDPIITEMLFRKFTERVQDKLEAGEDPGEAFGFAFTKLKTDSESLIKPGASSWMLKLFTSFFPMLVVSGIFVPMIIVY